MGLALATSFAALLNATMLLRGLLRAGYYQVQPGWAMYVLRLLLASVALVIVILWLAPEQTAWFEWHWQPRALQMALLCCSGDAVYFAAHLLVGTRMFHLRPPEAH